MTKKNPPLTLDRIRGLVSYDPTTGIFRNLVRRGRVLPGTLAGCIHNQGYLRIVLDGHYIFSHRLAWFYMHGVWPPHEIDHINRDRSDNRLCNLRLADGSLNGANRAAYGKSGVKGVYKLSGGRTGYEAAITVGGVRRYLGVFQNRNDAHEVYLSAAKDAFGEYAR